MVSNSILSSPTRAGDQWHSLRVAELPEQVQAHVLAEDPEAGRVVWKETEARWHTFEGALSVSASTTILSHVIRLRRAEPHLCFPNGRVFYYLDPESSYCQLGDLERNLEGQNRYAGSVRWTVGQHWRFCVEITRIRQNWWQANAGERGLPVAPRDREQDATALLLIKYHDHAEGVCQDLNVGLKRALRALWNSGQSEYDELEARAEAWVRRRLPAPPISEALAKFVKWVDMRAAWIEMQQFGFPDYFVEEAADGQAPMLPEEIEAFKRIQGETHAS